MILYELLWLPFFTLWGQLRPIKADFWSSSGNRHVLVIAPHPDDEAIGCAGAVARHVQVGDLVTLVFITDGRRSRASGLGPDQMASRRHEEAYASAKVLNVGQVVWLGLLEGEWRSQQLQSQLSQLLNQIKPQIIYAPSRIDFHPEHHRVAHVLADVLSIPQTETEFPVLRIYQIQVPLTPILANLILPMDSVSNISLAAREAYQSQQGSIARVTRLNRYDAALFQQRPPLEVFWQLTAAQYVRLHTLPPKFPWPIRTFRSLRPRPFSDPLAYRQGSAQRREFARALTP